MENRNGSASRSESSGSIGPVQQGWRHHHEQFDWGGGDEHRAAAFEQVWYIASMQMYNTMVELMRTSPNAIATVTAAIKHDIDAYFDSQHGDQS